MTSTWGKNLKLTIYGTSHGDHIGAIIENFPPNVAYDAAFVEQYMRRRAPGQAHSTTRKEADIPQILSGFDEIDGELRTNGEKIEMRIANTSQRSSDYGEMVVPRPGHADYPAYVKYSGKADLRGGGHFSGRLTAPLTWAGALCALWLRERGIMAGAHIYQLGDIVAPLDFIRADYDMLEIMRVNLPTLDPAIAEKMLAEIARVQAEGDSIGATIECVVLGLPVGVGEHMFRGVEGVLSSILYGIPAVKAWNSARGSIMPPCWAVKRMTHSATRTAKSSLQLITAAGCWVA